MDVTVYVLQIPVDVAAVFRHPYMMSFSLKILKTLQTALNLVLPPRCIATGEIVDAQGMLSAAFWPELQFIEAPFCSVCGIPFSFGVEGVILCAVCLERPPLFDKARAAVVYNDASRQLVLGFKYGDRLHAVDTFVPWMIRAGQELIDASEIIIPVPLHRRRLRERRFNQSALLAEALAKRTKHLTYIPDAMQRVRNTPPQKGLTAKERSKNVLGAFDVGDCFETQCTGKNILLIDDVFTTGATLNECARVLKKSGAACVHVLTVGHVTKEEF